MGGWLRHKPAAESRMAATRLVLAAWTVIALASCSSAPSRTTPLGTIPTEGASSEPPPTAAAPLPTTRLVDCSGVTFERTLDALRTVPSYAYLSEGRDEVWQDLTGSETDPMATPSTTELQPRRSRASYAAPDRFTEEVELVYRDDVIEAYRMIGDEAWLRFVGSMRWETTQTSPSANGLLALVEQQPDAWTGPNNRSAPGWCAFETSGSDRFSEQSMTLIVDRVSALPVDILVGVGRLAGAQWGALKGSKMAYHVDVEADVIIDEPRVDTSPIRPDEALYLYERRYCDDDPCTTSIVSESHSGDVDVFCVENGEKQGMIRFTKDEGIEFRSGCED